MLLTLLILLFVVSVALGVTMAIFTLLGASIYDVLDIREDKRRQKVPYGKWSYTKPWVSILIPAYNEELVIEKSLASLCKSSYRNLEIIVVDDCSTDNTRRVVRQFIAEHPTRKIILLAKRKNGGRAAALNTAFRRRATGDIIMALDADCTVDKYAVRNAVRHFVQNPKLWSVASNVRIMDHPSVIALIQQFEFLVGFRSKKFNTMINAEYVVGGAGAYYRREALRKIRGFNEAMWTEDIAASLSMVSKGNKEHRIKYASDSVIYTEPVLQYGALFRQRYRWKLGSLQAIFAHRDLVWSRNPGITKTVSWLRLPFALWSEIMLLIEPLIFTYFLYLAIVMGNPTLFAISCLTLIVILQFTIWSDEHYSVDKKIQMTILSPMMYLVFYAMNLVQIGAAIKSLFNISRITGRKAIGSKWISPKRMAQA